MTIGELFLESLNTGVITEGDVSWLATIGRISVGQGGYSHPSRPLMDQGEINLGCHLPVVAAA